MEKLATSHKVIAGNKKLLKEQLRDIKKALLLYCGSSALKYLNRDDLFILPHGNERDLATRYIELAFLYKKYGIAEAWANFLIECVHTPGAIVCDVGLFWGEGYHKRNTSRYLVQRGKYLLLDYLLKYNLTVYVVGKDDPDDNAPALLKELELPAMVKTLSWKELGKYLASDSPPTYRLLSQQTMWRCPPVRNTSTKTLELPPLTELELRDSWELVL